MRKDTLPRVLLQGIDTVIVTVFGRVDSRLRSQVREADARMRARAQREGGPLDGEHVAVGGRDFAVKLRGRRNTPLVVEAAGMEVGLGPERKANGGDLRIRLGAAACAGRDDCELAALAESVAAAWMLDDVERMHVSEIDLHCDSQGWIPPADVALYTTAKLPTTVWRDGGGAVTGIGFGYARPGAREGRSDLALRLEDKTQEIEAHSGKVWLPPLWEQSPLYRPGEPVWRAEARLRREALLKMITAAGVKLKDADVAATLAAAPELWRTVLSTVVLRVPGANGRRDRWPVDPAWAALARAFGAGPTVTRAQVRAAQVVAAVTIAEREERRALAAGVRACAARLLAGGEQPGDAAQDVAALLAGVGQRADADDVRCEIEKLRRRGLAVRPFEGGITGEHAGAGKAGGNGPERAEAGGYEELL